MKKKPTNYAPHIFISLFAFCVWVGYPGSKTQEPEPIADECHYECGECPDSTCVNSPKYYHLCSCWR